MYCPCKEGARDRGVKRLGAMPPDCLKLSRRMDAWSLSLGSCDPSSAPPFFFCVLLSLFLIPTLIGSLSILVL